MKRWLALCASILGLSTTAQAQTWPTQPVRIVVAFAPGGAADQLARAIGPSLQQALGQSVVIENKVGAGGNIAADFVAKATADGHTLLMGSGGIFSINPHLYARMPFDPAKDLVPVASVARVPQYLVVRADSGITSLAGLLADLKAHPGQRSFGSPGMGTSGHLASEMLLAHAGAKAIHAPYRGGGPAVTDLLGGQLSFLFDSGAALPHVRSGKLRLLGVASPTRSPSLPGTPTLDEQGIPGFNADTVFGLYAPAATPTQVLNRLHAEINRLLRDGPAKDQILQSGQVPQPQTVEQFVRGTQADHERYGAIIKASGIRAE